MNQYQLVQSDPDDLFSKSPNIVKYQNIEATSVVEPLKENKNIKTKKSVPSNITCHCAGKQLIARSFSI